VRRLLLEGHPAETRFFAFLGLFGVVLALIYWVVSYEVAGTVLLGAFGLACLLGAGRLIVARPAPGSDRPFLDETGRLPGDTLAPLALGLGIALAMTSVVFGPWLLVAGIVPLGWGAWEWFTGARAELDATVRADPKDHRDRR
jgi:hypothetical protein